MPSRSGGVVSFSYAASGQPAALAVDLEDVDVVGRPVEAMSVMRDEGAVRCQCNSGRTERPQCAASGLCKLLVEGLKSGGKPSSQPGTHWPMLHCGFLKAVIPHTFIAGLQPELWCCGFKASCRRYT